MCFWSRASSFGRVSDDTLGIFCGASLWLLRPCFWATFFSSRAGNVVQVEIFNDRLSFLIYLRLGTKTVVFTRVLAIWQRKMLRAFTLRSFYAQKFLHREVFIQTGFYTKKFLHRKKSLHKGAFTHGNFYTEKSLHRSFYTQGRLHTEAVTHRRCYTKKSLHFTQKVLTHRRVYRQKLLRKEVFTHRELLHAETFSHRSFYASMNMFKKRKGICFWSSRSSFNKSVQAHPAMTSRVK